MINYIAYIFFIFTMFSDLLLVTTMFSDVTERLLLMNSLKDLPLKISDSESLSLIHVEFLARKSWTRASCIGDWWRHGCTLVLAHHTPGSEQNFHCGGHLLLLLGHGRKLLQTPPRRFRGFAFRSRSAISSSAVLFSSLLVQIIVYFLCCPTFTDSPIVLQRKALKSCVPINYSIYMSAPLNIFEMLSTSNYYEAYDLCNSIVMLANIYTRNY